MAFGLDVRSFEPLAGVAARPARGAPRVDLRRVGGDVDWPIDGATSLVDQRAPDGSARTRVDRIPDQGYRLELHPQGRFLVSGDGTTVDCALAPDGWSWMVERALLGQVLPFAALLQGLEGFHASAFSIGDRLVGLTGPPGAGKSTLALTLASRGASFFTDDVLVCAPSGPAVTFGAGPGVANVHDPELLEAAAAGRPPFGRIVGSTETSARVLVTGATEPARLDTLIILDRRHDAARVEFTRVDDPFAIMASTFNVALRTPERLERQLDVSAAIAGSAIVERLTAPPNMTPAALATALGAHLEQSSRPGG